MKMRLPKGMSLNETNGVIRAVLYQTEILKFEAGRITLRSGGWFTMHTKKCINLVFNQYDFGHRVFQKKGEWFVSTRDGVTVPFQDGMEINL